MLANHDAWQDWEMVIEALDRAYDDTEQDDWDDENWNEEDSEESTSRTPGIRSQNHTVIAPLELFNCAAIRIAPGSIEVTQRDGA